MLERRSILFFIAISTALAFHVDGKQLKLEEQDIYNVLDKLKRDRNKHESHSIGSSLSRGFIELTGNKKYSLDHQSFQNNLKKRYSDDRYSNSEERQKAEAQLNNFKALQQLLSKSRSDNTPQSHSQLRPSKLLGTFSRGDNNVNLENYSRLFIILNPKALRSQDNRDKVNRLISSVVSSKQQTRDRKRYKGFLYNQQ